MFDKLVMINLKCVEFGIVELDISGGEIIFVSISFGFIL